VIPENAKNVEVLMTTPNETIFCTNCGVEIAWLPVLKDGRPYCCQDCLDSLPCECAGILELEEGRSRGRQNEWQTVVSMPASYPD
jgi:hypothetical protein